MKLFPKQLFFVFIFLIISPAYTVVSAQTISDSLLLGTWQGNMITVMGDYRLVFDFERNSDKELVATFQSPDQGKKKYDAAVEWNKDSISLAIAGVNGKAKYSAIYNKDSAAFIGEFHQSGFKFPLKLVKGKSEDILYHRPQTPVEPYPYKQEEVTIENKKAHISLAGTFTKPNSGNKFPVVILITGSGPQDRNESLMGHKPFLVLSDYLTRKGFAVLRCDDRGTASSGGDFMTATTEDFETDADAQVDYLKTRADVDVTKIGLIGHSEGGMIAIMMAAKRKDIAFIVLMAGPAMNIYDMMIMQDSMVAVSTGYSGKKLESYLDNQRTMFKIVINTKDSAAGADQLDKLLRDQGAKDDKIELTLKQLLSPWFRWFIRYDPANDLKKVHCPLLSIGGEKDIQVPAVANKAALDKLFQATGNKNYKAVVLPGLNHLFQLCKTCKVTEYKKIDETINTVALNTIGDWMELNVMKKKK